MVMEELLDEEGYLQEVTKKEVVSAFLQTIQRSLNCILSKEQNLRRNAIDRLHLCLLKDDGAGSRPPMDILQEAWDEVILEKVLSCVSDPIEKNRELAIQLIQEVAQSLPEVDHTFKEVVLLIEERMGKLHVLEGSEEIRLQLYSLLIDVILPECELSTLKGLIDPLHRIVAVTLFDQFHEVQKRACSILVSLANRDPEVFGNKTGVFLRGLIPCLKHAHSRVRIAVFQAIDAMMQCGLTKSLVAQQLAPGIKSLAFDHNVVVRELFFSSVGNWLNFKSNMMSDEEIHECVISGKILRFHLPELLPLLLLGITDDCIDIATLTYERLEGIGNIYKKFMDHLDTRATHGRGGKRFRTPEEDAKLMEKVMEEEKKCQEKYERDLKEAEEQRRVQKENEARKSTYNDLTMKEEFAQETSLYQTLNAQISSMEEELNQGALSVEKMLNTNLQLFSESKKELLHYDKESDNQQQRLHRELVAQTSTPIDTTLQESEPIKETFDSNKEPLHFDKDQLPHALKLEVEESTKEKNCVSISQMLEESLPKYKHENPSFLSHPQNTNNIHSNKICESKEEHLIAKQIDDSSELCLLTIQAKKDSKIVCAMSSYHEKNTSEITDEGAVKKLDISEVGIETLHLPKPWKDRANVGCRLMVEAFLRPMIEPALNELKQWTTPTRLSAARFLHTLMVLAEGLAKDNLDILIPAFFSAIGDDDVKVAKRVAATIHIIGFHVPPQEWFPLVLKPFSNTKISHLQRANVLLVIAAFLYGTPRKTMEEKHIVKICDKIYKLEVCCSNHSTIQNELLLVVTNLIHIGGALCKSSSFKIFVLLLQLQSFEGDAQFQKRSNQTMKDLAQVLGMESTRDLYVQHIHNLLDIITTGHEGGSLSLSKKIVFQTFLRNAKDIVGPHLKSMMPLLSVCLQNNQDPSLCLSFLQLLDELFEKQELESSWTPLAQDVLNKLLIPCTVWHRNKIEAAIQYGAMVAIGTFLRRDLYSQVISEYVQEHFKMLKSLVNVLKTCINEDNCLDVRRASTQVMYQFLRVFGPTLENEERIELIKVLSKGIGDSSNLIRKATLPALTMFFTTMPSTFSNFEVQDFLSFLVVHMDDEHPHIQEGVCGAIEACLVKKPEIVVEVLCNVRNHQRIPKYIGQLSS